MTRDSKQRRKNPRIRLPLWGVALVGLLIAILITGSTIWLFNAVRDVASATGSAPPEFEPGDSQGGTENIWNLDDPLVTPGTQSETSGPGLSPNALQPWSGKERVTVLVLGIDLRCDEEGPTHTDSMMLLTMDPVGLSAAALSLPRDLWVEVPGFGANKINQAYFFGEAYDYPGGGAALAVETVEAALGVPIDYYAAVNFQGVIDFVDLIGGIEVDAPEDIADPTYPDNCYGFEGFYLSAGEHELDGEQALKYARTRSTANGDIDRAARQQQVVLAARDKVLRVDMVPRLIVQAPQLWQSFRRNVDTNLTLEETLQLALLAQDIPRESIRTEVIDYNYVYNETTLDGQQVLVPNRESIRKLRDQLFAPPAIPTPVIENLPQLMREENARVMVHNGTSVFGLAGDTQTYLQEFGFQVVGVGNADSSTYPTTQILDFGSHPSTTRYLAQVMDIPPLNISYSNRPATDQDVLVILGNDWAIPTPTP
ncbi:MAG TPA: LCP family protein [Candidatus Binatia bacterium]|jgi:LCP family protein required for cell wall assembly|nr:LCP family protein [Candidatus Binatia bacterium]